MLKNLTLWQNKTYLKLWFIFHLLVAAVFGVMFAVKGTVDIDADLFNMLPKPVKEKALIAADDKLSEITGQNVFILAANEDFDKAKAAAENVYLQLKDSPKFKSISLYQENGSYGEILNYINKFSPNMLDDDTIKSLNKAGGPEAFSENALAQAYGAFTMTSLENLENDPFMLGELGLTNLVNYLQQSGTSMTLKDGVLAARAKPEGIEGRDSECWYVMIRGVLSKEGAALASKSNAVVKIHEVCDPLEKDGTHFVFSGTPFHSYKSSTNASREISMISTVSLLIVIVILLMIFKRPQPILFSIASIGLSTVTAIMATLGIFGKMHVLTLVFGTSLIGSCIDYSLHFFINWKGNTDCHTGKDVRNHLLKGLGLSLISTVLCYFVLCFAPFNLLKQMAVFSMAGIISTFLTAVCVYPYIRVPETGRKIFLLKIVKTPDWYNKKFVGRIVVTCMFIVSIGTLVICRKNFKIHNDLKKLYKMEGEEVYNEAEASQVLKYSPSAWYIVSGNTVEETLENEEAVTEKLREFNKGKERGGYLCTSAFIPSVKRQKESRKACSKLLPLAETQFEYLGYDPSMAEAYVKNFHKMDSEYIEMGKNVPDFIMNSIGSVWIGNIEGKYYSVVMPVKIYNEDFETYKSFADDANVFFLSRVKSMNEDLDKLSRMILILFIVVYVILFVVLKVFYNLKQAMKIISVPLLIILFIAAIFSLFKIDLEFFSITGMILVFGLGLDYVIYMIENERRKDESENAKLEPFAIGLSFFTTSVSFGALALSSFVPVHMLGLSIFIGLAVAYISTFFYTRTEF